MDLTLTRRGGSPGVSDLPRGDCDYSSRCLLFKMPPRVQQPCNDKREHVWGAKSQKVAYWPKLTGCRTSTWAWFFVEDIYMYSFYILLYWRTGHEFSTTVKLCQRCRNHSLVSWFVRLDMTCGFREHHGTSLVTLQLFLKRSVSSSLSPEPFFLPLLETLSTGA